MHFFLLIRNPSSIPAQLNVSQRNSPRKLKNNTTEIVFGHSTDDTVNSLARKFTWILSTFLHTRASLPFYLFFCPVILEGDRR